MRGRVGLVVLAILLSVPALGSAVGAATNRGDVLQLRPVLAIVSASSVSTVPADATPDGVAAVRSCDPSRLATVTKIPATPPKSLDPAACALVRLVGPSGPGYLYLGPARLTVADVKRAHSTFQVGQGYIVEFTLKRAGLRKFNQMARNQFGLESPQDEVAMVVRGNVISNPAFQVGSFTGPIQISGDFTRSEAKKLAATINQAARGR